MPLGIRTRSGHLLVIPLELQLLGLGIANLATQDSSCRHGCPQNGRNGRFRYSSRPVHCHSLSSSSCSSSSSRCFLACSCNRLCRSCASSSDTTGSPTAPGNGGTCFFSGQRHRRYRRHLECLCRRASWHKQSAVSANGPTAVVGDR